MHSKFLQLAALLSLPCFVARCSALRTDEPVVAPLQFDVDPEARDLEGIARGFPALCNLKGETLAISEFSQWLEGDRLHVWVRYDFSPVRWTEEQSVIQMKFPSLTTSGCESSC
jgi:hypothetical protein